MKRYLIIPLLLFFSAHVASAVPPIQEARLANGLRVLLLEAHNVPMVAMQLSMVAGSRFDPKGKGGTASMLADTLTDHTARRDYLAWADLLDADAIKLNGSVGRDAMKLSLTVLKDALKPGLDAFSEALLQPGWNEKRFKILRQDAVDSARKSQEEPRVQASAAAASLLYADTPYGHRPDGTAGSLATVSLQDLQALYRRQLKPQGAVLAVSGDITMAQLLPLLKSRLGGWQGKPEQGLMDMAVAHAVTGKSVDVALPTSQTLVEFVRLGPARNDANFFPDYVLNHILGGGGFSSTLMQQVRVKRGLVYGVYSYFTPLAKPGPYVIILQTKADQATKAASVVRQVMASMAAGKISARELQAAKNNLSGGFAHRMDSNHKRVGLISTIGLYNLPLDYLSTWRKHIHAVTLTQVKAQAATYLQPKTWNRVRVGANLALATSGKAAAHSIHTK